MRPLRSFFNHFYDTSFVICPRAFASWSSRPRSHIWPWCVPSCSPLAHCGNTRPSTATPWVNHGESVMSGASLPLRCGNMISYHEKDSMSAFWTVDRTFCKSGHAAIAWAEVASTRTKNGGAGTQVLSVLYSIGEMHITNCLTVIQLLPLLRRRNQLWCKDSKIEQTRAVLTAACEEMIAAPLLFAWKGRKETGWKAHIYFEEAEREI